MPDQLLGNHRRPSDEFVVDNLYGPGHLGGSLRNEAIHVLLHVVLDLGAALLPPLICRGHLLAVLQSQHVRQIRIRIRLRLIEVSMVWITLVATRSGAKSLYTELIHHVLMILIGCPIHSRWRQLLLRLRRKLRTKGSRAQREDQGGYG